jgi:exodeoxyribonuclease III
MPPMHQPFRLVSWNVNSLRARHALLVRYLEEKQPDVLCLQETRLPAGKLPYAAFAELGYQCEAEGDTSYAGVATLTKQSITEVVRGLAPETEHTAYSGRRLLCRIGEVWIDNVYVPTRKSIGKVEFLDRLREDYATRFRPESDALALCGDFNICFDSRDLASLRLISDAESFGGRVEDLAFRRLIDVGFRDCFRKHDAQGGSYSWFPLMPWAFPRNYGMRLDYVFATAPLYDHCTNAGHDREPRGWPRPSDHLPVVVRFGPTAPL